MKQQKVIRTTLKDTYRDYTRYSGKYDLQQALLQGWLVVSSTPIIGINGETIAIEYIVENEV